ncbi:unnamed protein product [Spirodela intermedia]|uniref:Uncharacterized protein n=1 Tax=Spirodela intermedia TaxID=51605 RepID=A0A7I8JCJ6_SPIIN|nr:unnamed protein product [Spirodela intermedia]CAA6667711.1 unnamed protein product [Spirodela intermedia]
MWGVDLDHRGRLALTEAPDNEFSSVGAGLQLSIDEEESFPGCGAAVRASATSVTTGNGTNTVEDTSDEFNVSDEDSLNSVEGVEERLGEPHLPLENYAASEDLKNGAGALLPVWSGVEQANQIDLGVEQEAGKFSSVEMDLAVGTSNKWQEVESDYPCFYPSRIMPGCVLQTSSHVVTELEGGAAHSEGDSDLKGPKDAISQLSQPTSNQYSMENGPEMSNEDADLIRRGTESRSITYDNSIEPVQILHRQDNSEIVLVSCVTNDCLEWGTKTLCAENLDKLAKETVADGIPRTEERNAQDFNGMEEISGIIQVHFENEMQQALPIERQSCDAGQSLPETSSKCIRGESSCPHSYNASSNLESLSMNMLSDAADAVTISSTCPDSVVNCTVQLDNMENFNLKSEPVSVVRRRNPERAASSKNAQRVTKSDQPPKSRNFRITSNTVTKKRCHSLKRARVSVWGALGNLLELFKHDSELCESKNKGLKKGRSRGGRRRLIDQRAGTSTASRLNQVVSTNPVILQEKRDHQLTVPGDPHGSVCSDSNDCVRSFDLPSDPGSSRPVNGVENKFETDGCTARQSTCWSRDLENQIMSCEPRAHHGDRDQESSLTQEASGENTTGDCHGVQSRVVKGASVEVADERLLLDPGTSPDSGVLHPTVDGGNVVDECINRTSLEPSSNGGVIGYSLCDLGSPVRENKLADVVTFSEAATSVSPQSKPRHARSKREKTSAKVNAQKDFKTGENGCLLSDYSSEGTSLYPSNLSKTEKLSRNRSGRRKKVRSDHRKVTCPRITGKGSKDIEKPNCFPTEHSYVGTTEPVCHQDSLEISLDNPASSAMVSNGSDKAGPRKRKSVKANSARRRKQNGVVRKKDNFNKSGSGGDTKQKIRQDQCIIIEESQANDVFQAGGNRSHLISEMDNSLSSSKPDGLKKVNTLQTYQPHDASKSGNKHGCREASVCDDEEVATGSNHGSEGQTLHKRAAWVSCDDCHKWRSIAVELADAIDETDCRWTCKDNKDKAFADCTIPQEKTNAEINAELEISDASCEEDLYTEQPRTTGSNLKPPAFQQSAWVHINSNMFLHRTRKTQTIDEFQKREYAKFRYFRCGKKGFGLKLLEDACQGQFLIEYVGEVLDMTAHEARQREYASRVMVSFQRLHHLYCVLVCLRLTVIDACAKGNLGRFINHSCEPNCRTEKWMVNGEVCIGLFAVRDIKKGEEVTFDYNYVRVFGAAAKRCVCGSAECRGYIGGDPLNSEIIVHSDSDEEHPEPVMIYENGEIKVEVAEKISESADSADLQLGVPVQDSGKTRMTTDISHRVDLSSTNDDAILRLSPVGQPSEALPLASRNQIAPDPSPDGNKPDTPRSTPDLKSSRSICAIKKRRCKINKSMMQKGKRASVVSHTQSGICRTGHYEGVEEKLNELLDSRGGINKHRDATKGYLKLLFFSAKSGDDMKNLHFFCGFLILSDLLLCESFSTRDLSLILDALLKTKSRTVLADVINKNGLQMLHNIMKQNRKNFNKIPIIRKLLKVLEFLAVKEILTPEHMSYLPSNAEFESFKDSIHKLTYHNDTQVHQMARNFRDKWLPRPIRKVNSSDRDIGRSNLKRPNCNWFSPVPPKRGSIEVARDTDANHLPSPSHGLDAKELAPPPVPAAAEVNSSAATKPRKRKTRWDQPSDATLSAPAADPNPKLSRFKVNQAESDPQSSSKSEMEATPRAIAADSLNPQSFEEVPPGFGPPVSSSQPLIQSDLSMIRAEAVAGHPQQRYRPHLTVSYGIPLALAEQLGTAADGEEGSKQCRPNWKIAPGMPFHPFPPLPPVPRRELFPSSSCSLMPENGRKEPPLDMEGTPRSAQKAVGMVMSTTSGGVTGTRDQGRHPLGRGKEEKKAAGSAAASQGWRPARETSRRRAAARAFQRRRGARTSCRRLPSASCRTACSEVRGVGGVFFFTL